jgi:hypothetical protein
VNHNGGVYINGNCGNWGMYAPRMKAAFSSETSVFTWFYIHSLVSPHKDGRFGVRVTTGN